MLQQEQEKLKSVVAEKKVVNLSSTNDLKIITETVDVQQVKISDPEIAIVVSQHYQNS